MSFHFKPTKWRRIHTLSYRDSKNIPLPRTSRSDADIRDRLGSDKLETIANTHKTTTQNSSNSSDSIYVLALAPHSAGEVADGIRYSINYTVCIIATYPSNKDTVITEIHKKYVVHVL